MEKNNIIHYFENGIARMVTTTIISLKKEMNSEILCTSEGNRIPLSDLISLNGHTWA